MPAPTATPKAALSHRVAAVVRPRTVPRFLRMTPAPMKPIPVTTCDATLVGSATDPSNPSAPTPVSRAAASATSAWVRMPAG
jgi:hypothetical protein